MAKQKWGCQRAKCEAPAGWVCQPARCEAQQPQQADENGWYEDPPGSGNWKNTASSSSPNGTPPIDDSLDDVPDDDDYDPDDDDYDPDDYDNDDDDPDEISGQTKSGSRPFDDTPSGDRPFGSLKDMFPSDELPRTDTGGFTRTNTQDPLVPPVIVQNPPNQPPVIIQPPTPPVAPQCPTFHPEQSIPGFKSQAQQVRDLTAYINSKGFRHDPDGIPWIPANAWVPWDGVTTYNPCTLTTAQLMAGILPPPSGINGMRGLRELFYSVNPFADNQNPTVAEIENWNIEVIRHFRRLLGFNQTTHPVSNDKCTYLKAAWAEERFRTDYWSTAYPGTLDRAVGPCTLPNSSNPHCGALFIPSAAAEQAPYLCPQSMALCSATGGAEGIANHNADTPWSIKMARIIGMYLGTDGIGGHTGPFVGRPKFGSAWYMNGAGVTVRTKWGGRLVPTCP